MDCCVRWSPYPKCIDFLIECHQVIAYIGDCVKEMLSRQGVLRASRFPPEAAEIQYLVTVLCIAPVSEWETTYENEEGLHLSVILLERQRHGESQQG